MTSPLSRLKQKIAQARIPDQPSKRSKGAIEGFEGDTGRGVCSFLSAVEPAIDEAEREAIAIEMGGVPLIYAKPFAAIQARPPADVPDDRWQQFIDDGGLFIDAWGRQAERLGWTAADLFGLHPVVPMARYDRMGLLWTLKGQRVVALTATEARLSGRLAYYRRLTNSPAISEIGAIRRPVFEPVVNLKKAAKYLGSKCPQYSSPAPTR